MGMSSFSPRELDRGAPIYVAGHEGLVGSAVVRKLRSKGFEQIVGRSSKELDLTRQDSVSEFIGEVKPKYVVLAAAKVGGIVANNSQPVDFLSENLRIQVNVMEAAQKADVERLLFLGSSCIYPRLAPQPIPEEALLSGPLEPTNEAYAVAKIAGLFHVRAVRRQYGLPWISVMPTNLYGPRDNFSLSTSHLLPAFIRRYDEAVMYSSDLVTNWGSGSPRREFMHVDDLADACLFLLEQYDGSEHLNVGTGVDHTIKEIAESVASAVGFSGETLWDTTKPDGTPRKLLDVSKLAKLGWSARIDLNEGIARTVAWYRDNRNNLRL